MTERRAVALFGAAATFLFWIEYLPPFKRVHLFSDIEGYHWPLFMYAFYSVRHFRFPLWDPSIYCGIPFAANIQAAMFYPGTWVLFLANIGQPHLRFKILEMYVFAHCWVGFYLCYRWLRGRGHSLLASLLAGFGFGFGGYMMSQNNHVGMVTSYVWTPLAWMGIDEAVESRRIRPLWKVTAAVALSFLAGYPGSWFAMCASTAVYALVRHWRVGLQTVAAIAASLLLVAVQLLPVAEAAALKTYDAKYGHGMRSLEWYIALVLPDYYGLEDKIYGWGDPTGTYLYLGVPALFGLAFLARRSLLPPFAVLGISFVFLWNPFDLVRTTLNRIPVAGQSVTTVNFLEPTALAFALIGATGIDAYLNKPARLRGGRYAIVLCGLYTAAKLYVGLRGGLGLPTGWWSAADLALLLLLFWLMLATFRSAGGRLRAAAAVVLCATIFIDLKVYGTNRGFNHMPGDADDWQPRGQFPGVDPAVFDHMTANRHYRIAVAELPHPTDLRRYRLATPQGFDPLLPERYMRFVETWRKFHTNRLFAIRPSDDELLQATAVRYFMTRAEEPPYAEMIADPDYRFLGGPESFYRVFEYKRAQPPWRFDSGEVTMTRWEPERRDFRVEVHAKGRFMLAEQYYPGWTARIDGHTVPMERWRGVFQAIDVPAAAHEISFRYRPRSVFYGALISALALGALLFALRRTTA